MQPISQELWDIWEAGDYTGPNRPYARVTVQKSLLRPAHLMKTMLIQDQDQVEIPTLNLKSITIDRRLGVDAAQMTLKIHNSVGVDPMVNLDLTDGGLQIPLTDFRTVRQLRDLGRPGYFSFRRGVNATNQIGWAYETVPTWIDMFIPNRTIRTWQGYGTDGSAQPWLDTRLGLTGTWLIDRVEMDTKGEMTITCRDYMKLAIEQRLYPPVIPLQNYPPEFCADHFVDVPIDPTDPASVNVARSPAGVFFYQSSVDVISQVSNTSVFGHQASHVFDGDWTSYWLSYGHATPSGADSFEWINAYIQQEPINFVQFRPKWGGYTVYISVRVGETWQGSQTIPYTGSNGSNIPYVLQANVAANEVWQGFTLPERYTAQEIRVTFTNLQPAGDGTYRAAIYDLEAFDHPFFEGEGAPTTTEEFVEGNIGDYVDIIKVLAGWAGFYWLEGTPADPILAEFGTPEGRIWGDFFNSGAYPVDPACIPASFWDNKSVMDGMNQIKEILGYILYVDATGGLICRMPNIWRTGNFVIGSGYQPTSVRVLDEKKVLMDYGVSIDDSNLRSQIIVVSSSDPSLHTAVIPGWSADISIPGTVITDVSLLGGQERIMLVPNYPFVAQAEVDKFAYLISLWLHWSYRKGKVRIPGNPAFMPDDQVLIYERITHEQFVHYIEGVSSSMDLEAGTWYLDVDTHWLGEGPDRSWLVNTYEDMPPALYAYLLAIGEIESGNGVPGPPVIFELPPDATTDIWDRIDDDLEILFPDPPAISFSADFLSDEDIAALVGSGYLVAPSTGDPGTVQSRSEQWSKAYWGPMGTNQSVITIMSAWQSIYASPPVGYPVPANTHPGQLTTETCQIHALTAQAWKLAGEIFAEEGYYVYSAQGMNVRYVAGTTTFSQHSWGLAVDINPVDNDIDLPISTISLAFRTACARIVSEIKTNGNVQAFGWGGYWSSKKDWMHLEIVCTAAQAQAGFHR